MIDFASIFTKFEQQLKTNTQNLIQVAKELAELDISQNRDLWYKALAVCRVAKQQNILQEDIFFKLASKMFELPAMQYSSIVLDDQNYEHWFKSSLELCESLVEHGYLQANTFLFNLYNKTRDTFTNVPLAKQYLNQAYLNNSPQGKAYYAKALLYGELGFDKDTELGIKYLTELSANNDSLAIFYLCNYRFNTCESAQSAWEVLQEFGIEVIKNTEANYNLADFYLREAQDKLALEVLDQGIQKNLIFSKYLKGMLCINGRFNELGCSLEVGFDLLKQAFEQGVLLSGHVLAMNYLYPELPEYENKQLGMYYLDLCAKYNVSESLVSIALELLKNESEVDTLQVFRYLDQAIENDSTKACLEKAIILLDGQIVEKDSQQAKVLLEKAGELGSMEALFHLGYAYHTGQIEPQADYQKALHYFEIAAQGNLLYAIEYSGRYYSEGYATEIDLEKAISYFQRAVQDFGSDYARVELASVYLRLEENQQNIANALELLQQALDNQYWYAAYRLGVIYEDGLLGEPDMQKAFSYYELAGSKDIPEAVYQTARFNRYGIAAQADEVLALNQFHKALELGYVDANVDIALAYEEGTCGLEISIPTALNYMLQAAEVGIAYAQYKVGYYYLYGDKELASDVDKGIYWLELAIEQGSALAMLTLGDFYLYGYGSEQNYDKAFAYYKKAEELNWISEGIGVCYQFGIGTVVDEKAAFDYYKQASERQYTAATSRLAQAYFFGIGCEQDKTQAFKYFKQIADQGMVEAMDYLGPMLLKGEGCQKDPQQAITYLRQAAQAGYNVSQYVLGNCYLQGLGVEQSDELALQWYQSAAENGNEEAQKIIGGPRKRRR
ncbi:tetratricopeptide repeat protein [Myroides sp. LJL119]